MSRPRDELTYANCWEDADLLLSRLGDLQGRRALSICSGGENSLSLLCRQPDLLVVVDKRPVQLFLLELKKTAMRALERELFLEFLGYRASTKRWRTYTLLRGDLGQPARAYWDAQRRGLEAGVIHTGRVERTFRLLARYVMPLIHDRTRSQDLMAPKCADEQERFYRTLWNNRRWRAAARILFGKPVIYAISPEEEFFEFHSGDSVADLILEKTRRHLSSVTAQDNHILHYLLFGTFGSCLPHSAREENYRVIRTRLDAVVTHAGMVETAFPVFGRFDAFNLSNIFEYTTPGTFEVLADVIAAGANLGARLAYWNVLVLRALSETRPGAFRNLLDTGRNPSVPDKGWHYARFVLDQRENGATSRSGRCGV